MSDKVEIRNVLQPGKTYRVDAAKFAEASAALLSILPAAAPGLTQKAMTAAMRRSPGRPLPRHHQLLVDEVRPAAPGSRGGGGA